MALVNSNSFNRLIDVKDNDITFSNESIMELSTCKTVEELAGMAAMNVLSRLTKIEPFNIACVQSRKTGLFIKWKQQEFRVPSKGTEFKKGDRVVVMINRAYGWQAVIGFAKLQYSIGSIPCCYDYKNKKPIDEEIRNEKSMSMKDLFGVVDDNIEKWEKKLV